MQVTCPQNHRFDHDFSTGAPVCPTCGVVGTHYNNRLGKVYRWTDGHVHQDNQDQLQEAMDAAFDNQFFGGGW